MRLPDAVRSAARTDIQPLNLLTAKPARHLVLQHALAPQTPAHFSSIHSRFCAMLLGSDPFDPAHKRRGGGHRSLCQRIRLQLLRSYHTSFDCCAAGHGPLRPCGREGAQVGVAACTGATVFAVSAWHVRAGLPELRSDGATQHRDDSASRCRWVARMEIEVLEIAKAVGGWHPWQRVHYMTC